MACSSFFIWWYKDKKIPTKKTLIDKGFYGDGVDRTCVSVTDTGVIHWSHWSTDLRTIFCSQSGLKVFLTCSDPVKQHAVSGRRRLHIYLGSWIKRLTFYAVFFKSVLKKVGLKLNKLLIYCVTAWRSRPTFKQSGDACKGLHADHTYHKNTDSSDHEKPQQRASNHVYVLFSSSPFRIHHKTLYLTMKETFALTSARWWIQEFKTTTQWDARYECNMKTRTWNNPGCLSYVGNLRRHCFFISTSCWRMGGGVKCYSNLFTAYSNLFTACS